MRLITTLYQHNQYNYLELMSTARLLILFIDVFKFTSKLCILSLQFITIGLSMYIHLCIDCFLNNAIISVYRVTTFFSPIVDYQNMVDILVAWKKGENKILSVTERYSAEILDHHGEFVLLFCILLLPF